LNVFLALSFSEIPPNVVIKVQTKIWACYSLLSPIQAGAILRFIFHNFL